jgi:hypothetical protein
MVMIVRCFRRVNVWAVAVLAAGGHCLPYIGAHAATAGAVEQPERYLQLPD